MQRWSALLIAVVATLGLIAPGRGQDLTKEPTLYVVGYAHLDTQWRWTYPQTIREFLANTLHDNFALLEKHPGYVFNFTGSRRYQMFKEYYPAEYERLKAYVAAGRWFPCGSSVDENDSNMPSAESLVRNVLYGNRFFRRELGVASEEYMLPDCFGFPAALPSVLAHCGIKGFSTQKLTWGSVVGIPFKVGFWEGPDGRGVTAALDPGQYDGEVTENLATSEAWSKRIEANGKQSGVFVDFHYYGTGDVGGAPSEASVEKVEQSVAAAGPIRVVAGPADAMFKAITPEMQKRLPRYKGELELTEHSAGSLTSQAAMKRWNRKNELLADAAERASVSAWWLGGRSYPAQKLEAAWTLVLGSQMHDIISGTALAKGYDYAWNDEVLAANQFAAVLEDAAGVVAGAMDTRTQGVAVVVFNPLSIQREDVVEADLPGDAGGAKGVSVVGPDGQLVAAQVLGGTSQSVRVAFLAKVPSVGFAVYDARLTASESHAESSLRVAEKRIENERYAVQLDDAGDVASIFDKPAKRELLSGPARLGLHYENPRNWPAWNQDWSDRQQPAKEFVGGPATIRVVERGPARVAVEVSRESGGSTFVQRIRLCAGGAADRLEFDTTIDWATRERSLRAAFPLSVGNPIATYDIQVGALERGNGRAKQYEYAFQQWFDLTDAKGDYGVTVLCDSKYGCDKPDDHTLRLTLLHTPGTRGGYQDQGTQDLGRQRVLYALSGHPGDWRRGKSAVQAARLNQPIVAFRAAPHDGRLGRSFSLLRISDENVRISAVKKAEDGDEVVLRLRELSGREVQGVRIAAARPIVSAREVDGQEREIGPATVRDGELAVDIRGFELRAFAVKLGEPPARAPKAQSTPLALAFDADVVSTNANRGDGSMDAQGRAYPAEQLPATIVAEEATFELGPTADGRKNAVACRGQEIQIPRGDPDRLDLLAAANGGGKDVKLAVRVDGQSVAIRFGDWTGYVGQWDHRLWQGDVPEQAFGWSNGLGGLEPGFVKPTPVAWFCSHHHARSGDAHYEYCYLYKIAIDLPQGARTVRLPDDERVKVLAATAVKSGGDRVVPASPLFDTLDDRAQDAPRIVPGAGAFRDAVDVRIEPRLYWRAGSIRYTLDGAEPTASSSVYGAPLSLNRTVTIQAAVVDGQGHPGPITSAKLQIDDATPPTVERVSPAYGSPVVRVEFSEPIEESSALAENWALDPAIEVRSVRKGGKAREVILELAAPPEVDRTYRLKIAGVKDASPAHNTMKPASIELTVKGPVFHLGEVAREQMGSEVRDVPGLPTKAKDAWTINLFVRTDKQPEDRTVIAGFGVCEDTVEGGARYLTKFSNGVHFWSRNRDVPGRTPLDLGRWQMLTATYDGRILRLFKDGRKIGEREVELSDDENAVRFAPPDPWEKKRRFEGEIREFTIWSAALSEDAIRSLEDASSLR
jgi:alpha-mannosidase